MKRIVTYILVLTVCVSLFVMPAEATEEQHNQKAVSLLAGLNILRGDENGEYLLDKSVNRAEFATFVLRMLNLEDMATQNMNTFFFSDVPEDHWAKDVISVGTEMGFIQGVGDNRFEPDRGVTLNEAVKILACALGYQAMAEKNGGYPGGYTKIGYQIGLYKKLTARDTGGLNRQETCLLIRNALTAKIYSSIEGVNGKTVLEEYLHLTAVKGKLTATVGYQRNTSLKNGRIMLDGTVYDNRTAFADEYIGCTVICYVREEQGEHTVYHIEPYGVGETYTVPATDIDPTTTLGEFKYITETDDVESLPLADSLSVFYNGIILSGDEVTDSVLKPATGNVMLRDGDGDGLFETILVEVYEDYVVNYIADEQVYAKFGRSMDLSKVDDLKILKNGLEITLENIQNGDILSVMRSQNGKKTKILVANESSTGYLTAVESIAGGNNEYTLMDEDNETSTFRLNKEYREALASNHIDTVGLSVSAERLLRVYYNSYGDVADVAVLAKDDAYNYGFVVDTKISENGLSGGAAFKMLTLSNRFEVFETEVDKKILYGRRENGTYITEMVAASIPASQLKADQLVKYKLDRQGYLTEVYKADPIRSSDHFSQSGEEAGLLYNYRDNVFGLKYYVDQNTAVFSTNSAYEHIMAAGKYTTFLNNGSNKYCTFYDVEGSYVNALVMNAPAVKVYDDTEDSGYEIILDYVNSPIFYIDSMEEKVADDGEIYTCLSGFQDGEPYSILVADTLKPNSEARENLKPGIAIQYEDNDIHTERAQTSDLPKQLLLFKTVFDFTNPPAPDIFWEYSKLKSTRAQISTFWGVVSSAHQGFCSLDVAGENYTASIHENTMILRYDRRKNRFTQEKIDALNVGENVFLRQRYQNTREAVIY